MHIENLSIYRKISKKTKKKNTHNDYSISMNFHFVNYCIFQENIFEELPDGRTKWTSKTEFQFAGFMMKVMGFLMPGAFKKQSKKYMNDFKAFAESGTSVKDN